MLEWQNKMPDELKAYIKVKSYKNGKTLIDEGASCDNVYMLIKGRCKIYTTSKSGRIVIQNIIDAPDIVGVMEQIHERNYLCTVEACGSVDVLVIPRVAYLKWLKLDNAFAVDMLGVISAIAYRQIEWQSQTLIYPLKYRFISYLLDCVERYGNVGVTVDKKFLAEQLATTVRHLNRVIEHCVLQGALQYLEGRIEIVDLELLKKIKDV